MDVKAGWKTSEFWLRLVGGLLAVMGGIVSVGPLANNPTAQALGVVVSGLTALMALHGYSDQRTALKIAALNAPRADIPPKPINMAQVP